MKHSILYAVLFAAFLLSLSAVASPLDDKVAALKKAIKDEVASKANSPSNSPQQPAYMNASYLLASLDQIVAQADNPNMGNNAEMQISQLLAVYTSDAVQKAGQDLIAEIRLERKAHADAAIAEIEALLKRVADGVTQAKKPEDLDGILVDLQKFQGRQYGGYNPENQALYQQVNSAFEFTKLWQNYLSHMATGQSQMAMNDLQNLSQNNYGIGIIPRSQILQLLAGQTSSVSGAGGAATPTTSVDAILKGIKTLDDMEPALHQLEPMRFYNGQGYNGEAQMAYNNLAPLVQFYTSIKAGLPTNFNLPIGGYGNGPTLDPALQAQLLVFALQHYFDSFTGTPPTPSEKPQAFVSRVIADAVNREDWPLLKKALNGQAYLNRSSSFGAYDPNNNTTGIDNLLAALNQEAAGQYALAVVSYQSALRVSDIVIPAKLIGDKLAAIKKDHPKEYEEGMQLILSPPMTRYYLPYRPGMPGYPGVPTLPVLSIPGTTTNQVVVPAPATVSTSTATPEAANPHPTRLALPSTNAPAAD